jgi:hypothetical protein
MGMRHVDMRKLPAAGQEERRHDARGNQRKQATFLMPCSGGQHRAPT